MMQAISAVGRQTQATRATKSGSGAIAFAGTPKTSARNAASNSNSITMIALIGLGVAAAVALVAGAIAYFRKPKAEPASV